MNGKHKDFVRIQGAVLLVLAAAMVIPFILALYYKEKASAAAFGSVICFCVLVGVLMRIFFKPSMEKVKSRDGCFVV